MIDPRLLADCHPMGSFEHSELLLHRNASLPWFILVPHTRTVDFLDLDEPQRSAVTAECSTVSRFIKLELGYDKVNFAGLGNVVPQLHLHVIGRSESDPCWPSPVWGNLPAGPAYQAAQLLDWQQRLRDFCSISLQDPSS